MGLMGGGKGGGKNALASKPNILNALRVQTSSYGQVIPIVYGQNRISGRLLWSGDFAAIPHTSTQKTGGKGLGSGGGNAITNTTYTYQTAVASALCLGPIQNIHNVWDTKGRLTLLTTSAQFNVPVGGGYFNPPFDGRIFHSNRGASRGDTYSFLQNDYGSDGSISFSGTQQTPMTLVGGSPGAGQYTQGSTAPPTTITGASNASPIVITDTAHGYSSGQQVQVSGVGGNTAANGTWTITVTDANHFSLNGSSGNANYTSGGTAMLVAPTWLFSAADAGKVMTITYTYSVPDSNSNGQPQQKLNLTLFTGSRPQTPWSYLTSRHPGQDLGYSGVAYVASSAMDLGESGTLPNLSFEVLGILPFNGGITDCNPRDVINDLLSNPFYGLGSGFYRIQSSGGSTVWKYYLDFGLDTAGVQYQASITVTNAGTAPVSINNNHGGSATLQPGATQNVSLPFTGTGAANLQLLFQTVNSVSDPINVLARDPALFNVSDGINLATPAQRTFAGWNIGTGATVTVNPEPQVSLGDLTQYSNFCLANGIFLSPVLDAQKSAAEWIQELLDVTNSAAVWSEGVLKIVPYGDTTAVGNGAIFIPNTAPVYDLSSNDLLTPITVKRPSISDVMNSVSVEFLNRANDYNVEIAEDKDDAMIAMYGLRKASPKQAHSITTSAVAKQVANFLRKRQVEIRSAYTFTLGWQFNLLEPMDLVTLTVPELGYNKKPVRITAIRENDTGQLEMDAEDFPFGTASPTLYPQQGPGGFIPQANADPGSVNTPIVFEAPFQMSKSGEHEIWMAISGGAWGNLLLYSEQFDNTAGWTPNNATVAANAVTDPLGGQTADAVTYSVAGTNAYLLQTVAPPVAVASQTFTFSCWVKTPSGTNSVNLLIEDQTNAVIANTTFSITSSWQRFSVTGTMGASANRVLVFIYNPATAGTVHLWGAQLENANTMSGYNQTTSLPVRVANPNWGGCHVWISQDNSEYHQIGQVYGPARMGALTGTAATRSNLLINSNTFNGSGWGLDGRCTLVQGNAVGPDNAGTSASTLSRTTATLLHASDLQQSISANANASPWTFSIWARAISGTQQIQLVLDDVTTTFIGSAPLTITTTWQRFSFSCAAGALVNTGSMLGGISILPGSGATSSASIQIFGAQLEKSSAMTPYIPTTTAAVTVSALVNAGSDPDVTDFFPVDLTQSAAILQSGTQADADSYRTLCYAGGEFISFQGVNLNGSSKYNVGQDGAGNVYLRRGLFGSNVTSHAAGESFARLDDSIFTYIYDPSFIGKTLYLKFTSFNTSGLMEQSIANASAYQFVVTGKFCQMETVSKNLLANPGFEYNVAGTPVSTYPNITPIANGLRVGDCWSSWNGSPVFSAGDPYMTVDLENSSSRSGALSVLIINKPGAVLPNDSKFYVQGVISDKVAVTPGETYSFGGWTRLVVDGSLPAGVNWWGVVRAVLYDASGSFIGQITYSASQFNPGMGTGNPDPVFAGPASSGVYNGGYSLQSTYFTVPTAFPGATKQNRPAFVAVWCTGILQNTGSAAWTMSGLQIDARFDDCFLFPQWLPVGDEVGKQGSMSNTYTGSLSYSATTSSVTWSWNINASRTDSALTVNNYSGSQAVTGLSTGTSYNFYPFIDEIKQVVSMVATGGVGSPAWAHSGTSVAWTQEQARGDHFPLSSSPMAAATTTSGTGGGSGGGTGGSCLRHDVLVRERTKGVIRVSDLNPGDWLSCPHDEDTPDGWVEVIEAEKSFTSREWVHTFFNLDDWLATTPGHPFTLDDGSRKRASELSLEDAVPCVTGITFPVSHALELYSAVKVSVTVRSARHVFYAGMKAPNILQHNFMPVS